LLAESEEAVVAAEVALASADAFSLDLLSQATNTVAIARANNTFFIFFKILIFKFANICANRKKVTRSYEIFFIFFILR
jgi:hypothetical protein